ncbi:glycosyltransferase family 87 protein [Prevotella jejuni]|uniref:glycosyltransferase family 87 protein n=1 Tax=Prevotella jejuni TaxID=1177574 RepID=UPI0028EB4707|nr:glycosyltransferase family 87 protein [Prevotella jejuni]
MKERIKQFLTLPFLSDRRVLLGIWTLLSLVGMLKLHRSHNNFLIFKGVYWHTVNGTSLYAAYPSEYSDVNHYGPLFSLIIAPFALLPEWAGMLLWLLFLSGWLFAAIYWSGLRKSQQVYIYWFCGFTLLTALFMQQFNIAIAAIILSSFFLIEKEHEGWAAFFIVLGTLVKLYGIVGLAFFLFSRHKLRLTLWLAVWSVILFLAPMAISSPDYIIGQYHEWFTCLVEKNTHNLNSFAQNISLLGFVRRTTGHADYSDLWLIIPGMALFALPYLRFSQYKNLAFRETILASVLLFVILFSTGSEASGYVIALLGVCIWYTAAPWKRGKWAIALMVFVFILSGMGNCDLIPKTIRHDYIQTYALRALPISIVWLWLCYELCTKDYTSIEKVNAHE